MSTAQLATRFVFRQPASHASRQTDMNENKILPMPSSHASYVFAYAVSETTHIQRCAAQQVLYATRNWNGSNRLRSSGAQHALNRLRFGSARHAFGRVRPLCG